MAATAPFEIMAVPFTAYLAPVDEARPDLADAPAGNWAVLGTNSSKSITEDGVTITHEQTVERFYVVGSTAPQKAFRTQEELMAAFSIADMTAEQYAKVLNGPTVTDTAAGSGTAGVRDFNLLRGLDLQERGLLLRSAYSPYADAFEMQYWIPRCFQNGNPAPVFKKGEPAMLETEWVALESQTSTNGFGKFEAQDEIET